MTDDVNFTAGASVPKAMGVMQRLLVLRLLLSLTEDDCVLIGKIIEVAADIASRPV